MRVGYHMAAGAAGAAVATVLADWRMGLGVVATSGLLDLDHVGQYWAMGYPRGLRATLDTITHNLEQLESKHGFRRGIPRSVAFPVLHSVELLLLLGAIALLTGSNFVIGCFAGMLLHLGMDCLSYPGDLRFFVMTWRLLTSKDHHRRWSKL